MSSLGYAMGGLGQGLAQGKEFRFNRQMKQADLALRQKQEADVNAATQHAQNQQDYQNLSSIVHDSEFQHKYTPEQQLGYIQKWHGFLQAHPEFDYGGELANIKSLGNQESNDILTNPTGQATPQMNPSVAQQPATSNPTVSPNELAPGSQAGTPNGLPPGYAGPPNPSQLAATPQGPTPAAAPPPPTQPQGGNQDVGGGLVSFASDDPDAPLKSAIYQNQLVTQQPDKYSDADRLAAFDRIASLNLQLAQSQESRARAGLADQQAAWVGPQAKAGIAQSGAETNNLNAQTNEIPKNASATRTLQYAEAGQAGAAAQESRARALAIPQQLQQTQEGIDLQRATLALDSAIRHGQLGLQNKELNLELGRLGLSVQQFQMDRTKTLADMRNAGINTAIAMGLPGFTGALMMKSLADNEYQTDKITGRKVPGPAYDQVQQMRQMGVDPGAQWKQFLVTTQQAQKGAKASGGLPQGFDMNGFIADPGATPQQKAAYLQQMGLPVPPALSQQLGRIAANPGR